MKIKSPKNFWSAIMFLGVGLFFAVWAPVNYQMGSAVRMGPAYFPVVLGGLLTVLGLIVLAGSLAVKGPPVPKLHFRPIFFVTLALLFYAYLMKPLGLMLATAALVYVSAYGGHEFKWKEATILYFILALFSWLVFVKGLTLPFPLWPAMFE
jgi:putative tricarboxylic transport membrane protein